MFPAVSSIWAVDKFPSYKKVNEARTKNISYFHVKCSMDVEIASFPVTSSFSKTKNYQAFWSVCFIGGKTLSWLDVLQNLFNFPYICL